MIKDAINKIKGKVRRKYWKNTKIIFLTQENLIKSTNKKRHTTKQKKG